MLQAVGNKRQFSGSARSCDARRLFVMDGFISRHNWWSDPEKGTTTITKDQVCKEVQARMVCMNGEREQACLFLQQTVFLTCLAS